MNTKYNQKKKLKKSTFMMDLAKKHSLKSCGIYEKVSKTTNTGKKKWKKAKRFIEQVLHEFKEYKDPDYPPEDENLSTLLEQNSKLAQFMAWYRLDSFLKDKYLIFHDIKIRNQIMRNRGYTYIIDALNVLSLQPGAVIRLFEKKKVCKEGIYSVWLNINGIWEQVIIDDYIPIYDDHHGKTKIFFTNPSPIHKEIWYSLLEKALAKAYGGYKNLFHGFENYAVRDFTGAPHTMHDVPYISPEKEIKQREVDYMNEIWEKLFKTIKKGYLVSAVPRVPTQKENIEKKDLNIPNKNYYLSKGIYSGHSYGVVTIEEIVVGIGQVARLVKLRNPWIDEVWEGDWSQKSGFWDSELRRKLNYSTECDNGEFWMNIRDFMNYFECLNIYKIIPGNCYTSISVKLKNRRFMRSVIRISVPDKGKYTFSVNQKDLRFYEGSNLQYTPIKLTLGMIQKDEFKLLSHTSSTKLRNTDISKLIDKGEYYLLIEKHNTQENNQLIKSYPDTFSSFNDIVVSSYGPRSCSLKSLVDREGSDTMFDYLTYYGWKGYSNQRIGKKLTDFKINFYDGSWNNLSLYLLSIPDSIIYCFKNDHDFGVELKSEIAGIINREIVGPDGRVSFRQDFSMNPGSTDVFILRETEKIEEMSANSNKNFQIKSVVGRKYLGIKENPPTFDKVYEYLKNEIGVKKSAPIEKDKSLSIKIGLFDVKTGQKVIEKNSEIKTRVVRYTSPMKISQYEDIFAEVQDQLVERKEEIKKEIIEPNIQNEEITHQERDHRRSAAAVADQSPKSEINEDYEFKQEINVLQIGDPTKMKMKRSHGGSILKNTNKNVEQEKMNLKILEEQIRSVKNIEQGDMTRLLSLSREEILQADNEDIKKLIKYFGLETFVSVYKADEDYLNSIANKLGGSLGVGNKEEEDQELKKSIIVENIPKNDNQIQNYEQQKEEKQVTIVEENGVRKVREVIKQYVPLSDNMIRQLEKVPGIDMKSSGINMKSSQVSSNTQNQQEETQKLNENQIQETSEEELLLKQRSEEHTLLKTELEEQEKLTVQLEEELQKQKILEQEYEQERIRNEIGHKKKLLQEQLELEEAVNKGEMTQEELLQILKLRESQGLNALEYTEPFTKEHLQCQSSQLEILQLLEQQNTLRQQLLLKQQELIVQIENINHKKSMRNSKIQQNQNPQTQKPLQNPQQKQPVNQEEQSFAPPQTQTREPQNAYELLVQKEREQHEKLRREMEKIIQETKQKLGGNINFEDKIKNPIQEIKEEFHYKEHKETVVQYQQNSPQNKERDSDDEYNLRERQTIDEEDFRHFTGVISKSSKLNEKTKSAIQKRIRDKLRYLRTGVMPSEEEPIAKKESPKQANEQILESNTQYNQNLHIHQIQDNSGKSHPSKMSDKEFSEALANAATFEDKKVLLDQRRAFFPSKDIRGSVYQAKKILESKVQIENQNVNYANVIDTRNQREDNDDDNQHDDYDNEEEYEEINQEIPGDDNVYTEDLQNYGQDDDENDEYSLQQQYYEQEQRDLHNRASRVNQSNYNVRHSKHSVSIVSDENRSFKPVVNDLGGRESYIRREENRKQYTQSNYTEIPQPKSHQNKRQMSVSSMIKEPTDYELTPNLNREKKYEMPREKKGLVETVNQYYENSVAENRQRSLSRTAQDEQERMRRLQSQIHMREREENPRSISQYSRSRSRHSHNPEQSSRTSSRVYETIPQVADNFLQQDKSILRESRYIKTPNFKENQYQVTQNLEREMNHSRVLERSSHSNYDYDNIHDIRAPTPVSVNRAPFANKKLRNTTQPLHFSERPETLKTSHNQIISQRERKYSNNFLAQEQQRQRSADILPKTKDEKMAVSYITNDQSLTTPNIDQMKLTTPNIGTKNSQVLKNSGMHVSNFMSPSPHQQHNMKFSSPQTQINQNRNNVFGNLTNQFQQQNIQSQISRRQQPPQLFSQALNHQNQIRGSNYSNNQLILQQVSPQGQNTRSGLRNSGNISTNNQNLGILLSPQKQYIGNNTNHQLYVQQQQNHQRSFSSNNKTSNLLINQGEKRFQSPSPRLNYNTQYQQQQQNHNQNMGITSPSRFMSNQQLQQNPQHNFGNSENNRSNSFLAGNQQSRNQRDTGRRRNHKYSAMFSTNNANYRSRVNNEKKSFVSGMIG